MVEPASWRGEREIAPRAEDAAAPSIEGRFRVPREHDRRPSESQAATAPRWRSPKAVPPLLAPRRAARRRRGSRRGGVQRRIGRARATSPVHGRGSRPPERAGQDVCPGARRRQLGERPAGRSPVRFRRSARSTCLQSARQIREKRSDGRSAHCASSTQYQQRRRQDRSARHPPELLAASARERRRRRPSPDLVGSARRAAPACPPGSAARLAAVAHQRALGHLAHDAPGSARSGSSPTARSLPKPCSFAIACASASAGPCRSRPGLDHDELPFTTPRPTAPT